MAEEKFKQGAALVLDNGTKVRIALHTEGKREITVEEASKIATMIFRTLTIPGGEWTVVE